MWLLAVIVLLFISLAVHFLLFVAVMMGNMPSVPRWKRAVEFIAATLPAVVAIWIVVWKLF
jgi:hypothetical protein